MAVTLSQSEAAPAIWPDAPAGLSDAAAALDPAWLWQRIEAWTAHRWTVRQVVWTVEGEGHWTPPLAPATVTTAEVWEHGAWAEVTLPPGPYGYELPGDGPYRVTATVGGGEVPEAVLEAYRRLAEYSVELGKDGMTSGHPSHTSHSVDLGGFSESFDRSATWAGRALINSGAADLLRPYRRNA